MPDLTELQEFMTRIQSYDNVAVAARKLLAKVENPGPNPRMTDELRELDRAVKHLDALFTPKQTI